MIRILFVNVLSLIWFSSFFQSAETMVPYIANSAFMIETPYQKILIDAVFGDIEGDWCEQPADSVLKLILNGDPPFDGVDAMLVTHYHRDHFNAGLVSEFMQNNPQTKLICPEQVAEKLIGFSGNGDYADRTWILAGKDSLDSLSIGAIKITAMAFEHGPFYENDSTGKQVNIHQDVKNARYIIEAGGNRIFHSGDASSLDIDIFRECAKCFRNINVGLIDQTFLRPDGQEILNEIIKPAKLVLMHIMPSRKTYFNELFQNQPNVRIFTNSLETMKI